MSSDIVVLVVVLLVLAAASGTILVFRWMMARPMYKPGMVRRGKNLREPLQPPKQSIESEWWQMSDDIQLYHFSEGIGRNVVIVHGGPGYPYRHPWPGLKALTSDYRFHYYDQRGCGRSSRPFDRFEEKNRWQTIQTLEQTLGIGAQVADLERIRRILGDEKLILIGSSFGGLTATFYAAEFPERVETMVLVAPADLLVMPSPSGGLFDQVGHRLPADIKAKYTEYMKEYFDFNGIFEKSEAEVAEMNKKFTDFYEQVYPKTMIDRVESSTNSSIPEQGTAGGWMVQAQYFSLGKRHDYRKAVKDIQAPVLVIHGTEDLQTASASKGYAEALPYGKFVAIDAAGHFVYQEQAEEFGNVVGRWLKGEFKS